MKLSAQIFKKSWEKIASSSAAVGLLSAVVVAAMTSYAQYTFGVIQLKEQFSMEFGSWKEKDIRRRSEEDWRKRVAILKEIREQQDLIMYADIRFWYASEFSAFESIAYENMNKRQIERMAAVNRSLRVRLGLGDSDSYFSESAEKYSAVRAKMSALLTEADIYFDDEFSVLARRYQSALNAPSGRIAERALYWRRFVQGVNRANSSEFDVEGLINGLVANMRMAYASQQVNIESFNDMYVAMRSQVKVRPGL